MRAVNLLPRQQVEQKRERKNPVALVAAIGGSAVLFVLVGGFLLANRSVDRQRDALATAKAELAVTPAKKMSAQTQAYRAAVLSQREQRSLALAAALGKRVAWDRVLRHVTLVMPDDVWLVTLTGNVPLQSEAAVLPTSTTGTPAPPSALPPTPTAVTFTGYTYSQTGVARLMERLDVLPDLKNVQLQSSTKAQLGNQTVVNFTIVSDIRKGRGAS
jgi:Tfp pilus assembly protein PilN